MIVPHIMGFGNHTDKVFQTDACIKELAEFIRDLNKKVMLVGFSLGAQLAFKLVSEYQELFQSAVIVSPWLIKEEPVLSTIMERNMKQLHSLKKKIFCNITGMLNGLPSKQRKEFVEQMQNVQEETVRNMVYNGITIESVPMFVNVSVPMVALAGGKEQKAVQDSVKKLSELNSNCRCEIWEKAGHNIPPLFAGKFNELICKMF